ncbi:hypothetical protein ACHAPF_007964 [Botrytis cinerea]
MSNQYDRNGNAIDRQDYHKFEEMDKSVRFDPKTRHNDIRSDQERERQIQAQQEKSQREQDYARTHQAGGSSSADGKGKGVKRAYDPVRDAENRR